MKIIDRKALKKIPHDNYLHRLVDKVDKKISYENIYWISTLKGFVNKTVLSYLKRNPRMKLIKNKTAFDTSMMTKNGKGQWVVVAKAQKGFLTDRFWINFTLPKRAKIFINDNKW